MSERPDPAFRKLYPNDSGLLMVDDLGNAEGMEHSEASALQYDRTGKVGAKAGFGHGVYRTGMHPLGKGFIAMSKECVLHAYDEHLQSIFETPLDKSPEIRALRNRFHIADKQLKNHIRCVASFRNSRTVPLHGRGRGMVCGRERQGTMGSQIPLERRVEEDTPTQQ